MRVRQVHIDGYGRFTNRKLTFQPGLQVIVGPNEQGKSTLRCFITDLLYGQKQGVSVRAYEEANDLRRPWQGAERYGGRLDYVLDNGEGFEIDRVFTREEESVRVTTASGEDVTRDFRQLGNGEVDFAGTHLGLAKEVFLGVATISHLSLDGLGDHDALARIREKLAALADSGSEGASADAAIALLAERVKAIGRGDDRTRPLPGARARLVLLDHELGQARELRRQMARLRAERLFIREETDRLRVQRQGIDDALRVMAWHEQAGRLREAEALKERIDTATKHCFALGAVREFPLDKLDEVRQAEALLNTARLELDRTVREETGLAEQLTEERDLLGGDPQASPEVPSGLAERHRQALEAHQQAQNDLAAAEDRLLAAGEGLLAAQEKVAQLPDFARLSADPVEWLTQLVTSFDVARRARDEETAQRDSLMADLDRRRAAIATSHALFKEHKDFPDLAREYELARRVREEQASQRASLMQTLDGQLEEAVDKLGSYRILALLCVLGFAALGITWFFTQKPAMFIPLGVVAGATLFYTGNVLLFMKRVASLNARIAQSGEEPGEEEPEAPEPGVVDRLLAQSGCETVRELEALFEEYREASAELTACLEVYHAQEARAQEAEERMPQLLDHYRQTFEKLGETIETEDDVQRAAGSAIGRYQEYREAKRRVTDQRAVIKRAREDRRQCNEKVHETGRVLDEVNAEVLDFLAECRFDTADHADATEALDAYARRNAELRERRTRIGILEEQAESMARKRKADEEEVERREWALDHLLAEAGVTSVAQWQVVAKQAREYQDVWQRRARLEQELAELLDGRELNAFRREITALGPLPDPPAEDRETLVRQRDELTEAMEALKEQDHALHVTLTERGAGMRPIAEIEENRAEAECLVAELELELESTGYAMALIEDIARDKHARIAPELARRAGEHLAAITGGAYGDVRIGRDLSIGIPIPARGDGERPEKFLSKGTVDQVYLALRLALTQCISETGESVPMLLDDPLANYDDARLERTMALLSELGRENQIFLFTCREDVVRVAEALHTPVIRL